MKPGMPEVTLYVNDLARSTRFYHLGLQFAFEGYTTADGTVVTDLDAEGEYACATVVAPSLRIHLIPVDAGTSSGTAADHLIQVANVDAVHAAVLETGNSPSEVVDQPWQRREFTVVDDDGYVWTVSAPIQDPSNQVRARTTGEIIGYVSAAEFMAEAKKQNLTLQEYLDKVWGGQGTLTGYSEGVFDQVARFGVFERPLRRVVEIGTGVGMHVRTVQQRLQPESYESYEPETAWAEWLDQEYGVLSHPCDGLSMLQTPTSSADLVHAHGVFVALLFLTAVQYFREMGRVLRPGGFAVFDVLTEEGMGEANVDAWLDGEFRFPVVYNREFVKELLQRCGFEYVGDFQTPAFDDEGLCQTNYFIFRKL